MPKLYRLEEVPVELTVLRPGRYAIHHPNGHALDIRLLEPVSVSELAGFIRQIPRARSS